MICHFAVTAHDTHRVNQRGKLSGRFKAWEVLKRGLSLAPFAESKEVACEWNVYTAENFG